MNFTIHMTDPDVSVSCESAEDTDALLRLIRKWNTAARVEPADADEDAAPRRAPRRIRAARKARKPKQAATAPTARIGVSTTGRKPSPLALDVYAALEKTSQPDLAAVAKKHGLPAEKAKAVIRRGLATGKLRALPAGGWVTV